MRSGRCSIPGWRIGTAKAREALVLRHAGVGAREQEAPVGDVGVAGPDLVAVDHVLVAVARRRRAQRREVGAGVGLAEPLAPALAPADQTRKEALLDRFARMRRDALDEIAEARARRRSRRGELLVEEDVEDGGQLVTAEAGGPGEAEEARVVEGGVPLRLPGPVLVVGGRHRQARGCARRARRGAAPGTPPPRESHESPSASPSRARCSCRSCSPASPNQREESNARRRWTCTRQSHVFPIPPCTCTAVSQTVRAARAP